LEALKAKLIDLEECLFEPKVRGSIAELDKLLGDDFIEITAAGSQFDKQAALARLPFESPPLIQAQDYQLRMLAVDCAQLLYRATMVKAGETEASVSLRCSIWQLRNQQWQMVYHQGTYC
jgi:hypothetical protein